MRGRGDPPLVLLCLAAAVPAVGCGHELLRPTLSPDPQGLEAHPAALPAPPRCTAGWIYDTGWSPDPALREDLARALGGVVAPAASTTEAAAVEARLEVRPVDSPRLRTFGNEALVTLSVLLPPLIPIGCIYFEYKPELIIDYELTVGVLGEPPAGRYATTARGTISAQAWGAFFDGSEIGDACRSDLSERAVRSLTSRFVADEAARARLAADLDAGPRPLEALLVTRETHPPRARWRTHQLVAWKNERLTGHLAELGAADLRSLVTRLETTASELAREAELTKDAATRAAQAERAEPAEGEPGARERELSLLYLERVEVLRAILASIRDELDARGR